MFRLICVGKIKETFYSEAINEYLKRLSAFTKVECVEVKEVNIYNIEKNILEEGKNILKVINKEDYVITLEIKGKTFDSVEFSKHLENLQVQGKSCIDFVIGGSNGLSNEVINRKDENLSFSDFTFPHQLMRVIALEQLYRAMTIINHKEYHK